MESDCSICAELDGWDENNLAFRYFGKGFNRILFESTNFAVFPSLGQIVEGYLLVVPKEHRLSVAELPQEQFEEFEGVVEKCRNALEEVYGTRGVMFEHGSCGCSFSEKAGACTLHAHLNLVPASVDVLDSFEKDYDVKRIGSFKDLILTRGVPYFLYGNLDGELYFSEAWNAQSQYFRKLIADAVGADGKWDWRKHPGEREIIKTLSNLKDVLK